MWKDCFINIYTSAFEIASAISSFAEAYLFFSICFGKKMVRQLNSYEFLKKYVSKNKKI